MLFAKFVALKIQLVLVLLVPLKSWTPRGNRNITDTMSTLDFPGELYVILVLGSPNKGAIKRLVSDMPCFCCLPCRSHRLLVPMIFDLTFEKEAWRIWLLISDKPSLYAFPWGFGILLVINYFGLLFPTRNRATCWKCFSATDCWSRSYPGRADSNLHWKVLRVEPLIGLDVSHWQVRSSSFTDVTSLSSY